MPEMNNFERHTAIVLAGVITSLLVWIGLTTQSTAIGIAELRVEVRGISTNAQRIERIEKQLDALEYR